MGTVVKKLYEAMFLVDSVEAQDWDAVITTIKTILERAKTEIVSIDKWGDRRLAYEIKGKARGTYILCYFRADGDRIRDIERDVQLSERVMRVLVLSAETREKQDIEKALISQKGDAKGKDEDTKTVVNPSISTGPSETGPEQAAGIEDSQGERGFSDG